MNWMLDLLRSRPWANRTFPTRTDGLPRRRQRLGIEPLEGRRLLAGSSLFSNLFPSADTTTTSGTNPGESNLIRFLRRPTNLSFPPYDITVGIGSASDPGQTGAVFDSRVSIQGTAPPFSTVWLAYGPVGYFNTVTQTNAEGIYTFSANVPQGTTLIRTFAGALTRTYNNNFANNYSNIASVRVVNANPIIAWNAIALRAIENANLSPEAASRDLAILHSAQYDAVAAATDPRAAFLVQSPGITGASPVAAANHAAASVLSALFPEQAASFDVALAAAKAGLPNNASVSRGAALGQNIAERTLAARVNDGSTLVTPTGLIPNPNWGQVRPFAIARASQFRPTAAPAVGTTAFDQALSEVTRLGRADSTARTAAQTTAARYWDDGSGTSTNPGHWNEIAQQVATDRETNLFATARTFALLDIALADAAIAAGDAKFAYPSFRPITAIQATTDPTWTPLLATPATPSYVSDQAAFGAAASEILGATYGRNTRFTTRTIATSDRPARTFASFAAAATENADSRIFGGVNFRFDTAAGSSLGDAVGKAIRTRFPSR